MHHSGRPGEDIQGALNGRHLFSSFQNSKILKDILDFTNFTPLNFNLKTNKLHLFTIRQILFARDTAGVQHGLKFPRWSADEPNRHKDLCFLGTEVEVNCLGTFLATEASTNKVKRGLKNVTLSVECGPLTRDLPPASSVAPHIAHPTSLRESPRVSTRSHSSHC